MVKCLSNERKYVFLKIVYLFYYCRKMWIIRNLRCHYLQNTITNSEKIFDTNSINHFTNIAKVLRGGVSELIGNYEYLRILPQPSEVKTFGMVMIRNCFTNVIKVFKGGVSYQTGKYEYLHILPQPGEVKNFGMATIRNCLFGMKLRSKYFRKEYILSKNYRAELVGLFGNPVDENPTGPMMEAGFAAQGLNYRGKLKRCNCRNTCHWHERTESYDSTQDCSYSISG